MSKKKYVITAVTLGIIAAASAGLVAGANLLTMNKIRQNEIDKINKGMSDIFGKTQLKYSEKSPEQAGLSGYKYVATLYTVKDNLDAFVGYAIKTSGSNMYGKITLIVGMNSTYQFVKLSVVVNEQTYASTLVDNYINPLNDGSGNIDDVSCGATYGAKLVRDMVNEATDAASKATWGA